MRDFREAIVSLGVQGDCEYGWHQVFGLHYRWPGEGWERWRAVSH